MLAGVAGLGTAVTGCFSRGQEDPVEVLVAGSLANAFGRDLAAQVDPPVRVEAHGSAVAARMVANGVTDPDIIALADPVLFDRILDVPWYVSFATNALVISYTRETAGGTRVAEVDSDRWWSALRHDDVSLGRTDPDRDPLGYRTLFGLELASEYYSEAPDLRSIITESDQVYPETQLFGQFETGSVDAVFAYRSMAIERDYETIDLPQAVDLSSPALAESYERVTYTLPDGTRVRGAPISYVATVRRSSPRSAVRTVFDAITSGRSLQGHGFGTPDDYPRWEGDVPHWSRR
jgi:molybdate/tungstate transport system substrate-binding protein